MLANNLAYYAEGDSSKVRLAKLVLNINNKSNSVSSHLELLKVAQALSLKVSGEKLPQPILRAIKSGKNASAKISATNVKVIRIDWPHGNGYEIKVIFE